MKVAILTGSVRSGRQSHKIAHHLERKLRERGAEADLIDLAETPLPILEDRSGRSPQLQATVQALSAQFRRADALVFVTPEYHGSFSGVLKNALDYFWEEFNKKPIGVVAVSAGKLGGINASTQLQHVILSLGAFPLPLKLLVPEVQNVFDESLQLRSEQVGKAADRFLDEYLWFAQAIVQAKQAGERIRVPVPPFALRGPLGRFPHFFAHTAALRLPDAPAPLCSRLRQAHRSLRLGQGWRKTDRH